MSASHDSRYQPIKQRLIPGMRWSHFTILGVPFRTLREDGIRRSLVVVECDCGAVVVVQSANLLRGGSKSCGCFRSIEASRRQLLAVTTHGGSKTRLWNEWRGIKSRCASTKSRYHQLGIRVCGEWKEFVPFRDWAMANGYDDSLTIDRIDSAGNYEPNNCRWISGSENTARANRARKGKPTRKRKGHSHNYRSDCTPAAVRELAATGMTIKAMAKLLGVSSPTISARLAEPITLTELREAMDSEQSI